MRNAKWFLGEWVRKYEWVCLSSVHGTNWRVNVPASNSNFSSPYRTRGRCSRRLWLLFFRHPCVVHVMAAASLCFPSAAARILLEAVRRRCWLAGTCSSITGNHHCNNNTHNEVWWGALLQVRDPLYCANIVALLHPLVLSPEESSSSRTGTRELWKHFY